MRHDEEDGRVQGPQTGQKCEHRSKIVLCNLQNNLVALWTQLDVDEFYQNLFLTRMDHLTEEAAGKEMAKEIRLTYEGKSSFFLIREAMQEREQVLQQIETQLKITCLNQPKFVSLCQNLDRLRKCSLVCAQSIIKYVNKLFEVDADFAVQCHLNHPYFDIMNEDNQLLKNSILSEFICFKNGYDPFLLYHYELLSKTNDKALKKHKAIQKLFTLNISYTYRLLKAQRQILKFMSEGEQDQVERQKQKSRILRILGRQMKSPIIINDTLKPLSYYHQNYIDQPLNYPKTIQLEDDNVKKSAPIRQKHQLPTITQTTNSKISIPITSRRDLSKNALLKTKLNKSGSIKSKSVPPNDTKSNNREKASNPKKSKKNLHLPRIQTGKQTQNSRITTKRGLSQESQMYKIQQTNPKRAGSQPIITHKKKVSPLVADSKNRVFSRNSKGSLLTINEKQWNFLVPRIIDNDFNLDSSEQKYIPNDYTNRSMERYAREMPNYYPTNRQTKVLVGQETQRMSQMHIRKYKNMQRELSRGHQLGDSHYYQSQKNGTYLSSQKQVRRQNRVFEGPFENQRQRLMRLQSEGLEHAPHQKRKSKETPKIYLVIRKQDQGHSQQENQDESSRFHRQIKKGKRTSSEPEPQKVWNSPYQSIDLAAKQSHFNTINLGNSPKRHYFHPQQSNYRYQTPSMQMPKSFALESAKNSFGRQQLIEAQSPSIKRKQNPEGIQRRPISKGQKLSQNVRTFSIGKSFEANYSGNNVVVAQSNKKNSWGNDRRKQLTSNGQQQFIGDRIKQFPGSGYKQFVGDGRNQFSGNGRMRFVDNGRKQISEQNAVRVPIGDQMRSLAGNVQMTKNKQRQQLQRTRDTTHKNKESQNIGMAQSYNQKQNSMRNKWSQQNSSQLPQKQPGPHLRPQREGRDERPSEDQQLRQELNSPGLNKQSSKRFESSETKGNDGGIFSLGSPDVKIQSQNQKHQPQRKQSVSNVNHRSRKNSSKQVVFKKQSSILFQERNNNQSRQPFDKKLPQKSQLPSQNRNMKNQPRNQIQKQSNNYRKVDPKQVASNFNDTQTKAIQNTIKRSESKILQQQSSLSNRSNISGQKNVKLKPGKVNATEIQEYIVSKKISKKYKQIFESSKLGNWQNNIKKHISYLTQFHLNGELAVFGICQPAPNPPDTIIIRYWGPLQGKCTQGFEESTFKTYIDYIEKYTTCLAIYMVGEPLELLLNNGFVERNHGIYERKRVSKIVKQKPTYPCFLSLQCSCIRFEQHNAQSHGMLYSEQIESFSPNNYHGNLSFLTSKQQFLTQSIQSEDVPNIKQISQFHKSLPTIQNVNKFLQNEECDTYEVNESMKIKDVDLLLLKLHSSIKSNFCAEDNYIQFPAFINNPDTKSEDQRIYELQFIDHKISCYFGSGEGYISAEQFTKNIKREVHKTVSKKEEICVKMFSKQLYGQIKTQKMADEGYYGNWEVNFVWQPQLHGKVKVNIEKCKRIGPQPFYMAIFIGNTYLLSIKVVEQDCIQ